MRASWLDRGLRRRLTLEGKKHDGGGSHITELAPLDRSDQARLATLLHTHDKELSGLLAATGRSPYTTVHS